MTPMLEAGSDLRAVVGVWLLVVVVLGAAVPAVAEGRRVALVIGNSEYQKVAPLMNPANDAGDIAAALGRIGFEVMLRRDLTKTEMRRTLGNFARSSQEAEVALLYFAGHGMEIDGVNYLMPTDADLRTPLDVSLHTINLQDMLRAVSGASTLRLVMLDACRDNPFIAMMQAATRSLTRGLARVEPPPGVLVSYAAKGGTVALDGEGERNSPYAKALLAHLEEPGLEVGKLFRRVRDTVHQATGGVQEPFTYGSLPSQDIFLAGALPPAPDNVQVIRDFSAAVIRGTATGWQTFLRTHEGTGANPELIASARRMLRQLEAGEQVAGLSPNSLPPPDISANPMVRACDGLAADPDDAQRPDGVAGVEVEDIETGPALNACRIASEAFPEAARPLHQLARAREAAADLNAARQTYERAIAMGYPAAQIRLGRALLRGEGEVYRDTKTGIGLLQAAFDAGSPAAARLLGLHSATHFGRRLPGLKMTVEYFLIGAERGDTQSMYEAGYRLLSKTTATPQETAQGLRLLEQATAADFTPAQVRLANHFLRPGPEQDLTRAMSLLERAARDGHRYALNSTIRLYKGGGAVRADAQKAAAFILLAAERGSTSAMAEAGYLHEIGRGISRDVIGAARFYFRSLEDKSWLVYRRAAADWDDDVAKALQRLLRSSPKARYRGPIDGDIGRGSRAAMVRLCECTPTLATIRFRDMF